MNWTAGPASEVESLYRQHGPALLLFAMAICGEKSRAQDAVHQVFAKLIEGGDLARVADKKAYLFTCVRNALLNQLKRDVHDTPLGPDSAWFYPPDRDYSAEQTLRRSLVALPDDQRQVVVLHIWGELTFSQVGDLLGISANTAASRYRYALDKLRDAMLAKEDPCVNSRR